MTTENISALVVQLSILSCTTLLVAISIALVYFYYVLKTHRDTDQACYDILVASTYIESELVSGATNEEKLCYAAELYGIPLERLTELIAKYASVEQRKALNYDETDDSGANQILRKYLSDPTAAAWTVLAGNKAENDAAIQHILDHSNVRNRRSNTITATVTDHALSMTKGKGGPAEMTEEGDRSAQKLTMTSGEAKVFGMIQIENGGGRNKDDDKPPRFDGIVVSGLCRKKEESPQGPHGALVASSTPSTTSDSSRQQKEGPDKDKKIILNPDSRSKSPLQKKAGVSTKDKKMLMNPNGRRKSPLQTNYISSPSPAKPKGKLNSDAHKSPSEKKTALLSASAKDKKIVINPAVRFDESALEKKKYHGGTSLSTVTKKRRQKNRAALREGHQGEESGETDRSTTNTTGNNLTKPSDDNSDRFP